MELIEQKLSEKIKQALGVDDFEPEVFKARSEHGDLSTNAAMIAAKDLSRNPKELADEVVGRLKNDLELNQYFSSVEAVPPGFINFYFNDKLLLENLQQINKKPNQFGSSEKGKGQLALVEYFQLNAAKMPHVGHLRSAVIGDSLKRIFISQGYKTVSDTHLGDWGTQFGMLLWGYKNLNGREKVKNQPLEELSQLYVEVNSLIEKDPQIREASKEEFVKLEQGDEENRRLWEFFMKVSREEFQKMSDRLQLLPFDYDLGESFYENQMKKMVERLKEAGLIKTGETGEQYIDLEEWSLGRLICIKSDGGTTYELRDLATLAYRYDELAAEHNLSLAYNIYVVDVRQAHDFKQVFKTMSLLGYDVKKSIHVGYGFMTMPEGAFSTRKGNIIALDKLIDEAKMRALEIINDKNPQLPQKEQTAYQVALGAIKYADLSSNPKSNVVFEWEQALNFEGNTGPYLQYSHARLQSILRKVARLEGLNFSDNIPDLLPEERNLLRHLMHFNRAISEAQKNFTPNTIATYLYDLASLVNRFYQEAPVLAESDEQIKSFRLNLVQGAAAVLHNGLYLLGIEAPEQM